jgi:hypothetical protein
MIVGILALERACRLEAMVYFCCLRQIRAVISVQ